MSDSDTDDQRPKRRSRNISDLTEQQVKHKRDLDRKAQRALRQRTKSRIQDLEESYSRLEASKSENEALMLKEVETLRQQNRHLKAKLEHIRMFAAQDELLPDSTVAASGDLQSQDITGQQLSSHGISTSECSSSHQSNDTQILNYAPTEHNQGQDSRTSATESRDVQPSLGNEQMTYYIDGMAQGFGSRKRPELGEGFNSMILSPTSPSSAPDPVSSARKDNVGDSTQAPTQYSESIHSRNPRFTARDQYLDGPRRPPVREISASNTSPEGSESTQASYYSGVLGKSLNVSSFPPQHLPATCPLDQILLDFLSSRRVLVAGGNPMDTVLGPEQPFVAAILRPELAASAHPVSRVMAEVLSTFPKVDLPEKIAFMYLMHGTMKWQISPTKENYVRLPVWLRPTASQITISHAAWLDNIPWPRVRDILIEKPEEYPFQRFSDVYSQNVTVNWPFDAMDAVITTYNGTQSELVLNPLFEKHIRRLKKWTVSRDFETHFPELVSAVYSRE